MYHQDNVRRKLFNILEKWKSFFWTWCITNFTLLKVWNYTMPYKN